MEEAIVPAWIAWAYGALMTVINFFLGYLILPLRRDVEKMRDALEGCKTEHRPRLISLEGEMRMRGKTMDAFAENMQEVRDRMARTETKVDAMQEGSKRIEKKLDDALNEMRGQ